MGKGSIGIGVLTAWAAIAAGCSSQTCTERGCIDNFTATVRRADGTFPAGDHRIEVLIDGVTQTCTFSFTESSPGIGSATPTCPGGLSIMVGNATTCSETHSGNSVSLRCDPIPGQFVETITFMGKPAQVHVWQYVGDVAILDAAAMPSYADYFPNGPECGGACRQASASWTLQDSGVAACSGTAPFCTTAGGSVCSDVGQPGTCQNGQWTCPPNTTPCAGCVGAPPPGCTCSGMVWSCPIGAGSGQ